MRRRFRCFLVFDSTLGNLFSLISFVFAHDVYMYMYTFFYLWIIDHLGAEVTVTSLAAVHALWWQKNSNNQWNKICKIHGIREKISLLVLLDVRIRMQKKDGLYFLEYC